MTRTADLLRTRDRIFGDGPLAELIRATDWSASPLGPVERWSESLLCALNLMLSSPLPTALYWGPSFLFFYNDAFRPFTEGRHPRSLGHPAAEVWAEAWYIIGPQLRAAFFEGTPTCEENALVPIERYGVLEDCYWTYTFSPVYEAGEIAGVLNICQSTTVAVVAARVLRQSEARAQRILESIADAVIVTDADGRISRMNPVAVQLTGWEESDAFGKPLETVFPIVHETTRKRLESPAAKVKRLGRAVALANHTLLQRKDGTELHIEDSGAPVRDDEGRLTGIVLIFRDVSEKRAIERNLRESEEQTRFALAAADLGVFIYDLRTGLATRNRRHEEIFGHGENAPEWTFARYLQHVVPKDRERVAAEFRHVVEKGCDWEYETEILRCDGAVRNVWVKTRHMRDAKGTILQMTGLVADITDRKRAEAALRASEERFRTLFELVPIGLRITDATSRRILLINAEMARMTGYTQAEMQAMDARELILLEDRDDALYRRVADAPEGSQVVEKRWVRKDGEVIWVRATLRLTQTSEGEGLRMLSAVQDITESRQTQIALIQTEKLAAVGRLAASIAHEINNPLEAVTNLLYLAKSAEEPFAIREYLDSAERELHRVAAIASQTLRFHRQSTSPRAVTCEDLLESVVAIYSGKIHNAELNVIPRLKATDPLRCFDGEIRQVLSNLVGNAIDAMPAGGSLWLRTRRGTDWKTDRTGLVFTVADDGKGMSAHTMRRIFEAFYTTKGNNGTGLGLWVSHEIVARHEGRLRVRSRQKAPHHGTIFTLFLPFDAALRDVKPEEI